MTVKNYYGISNIRREEIYNHQNIKTGGNPMKRFFRRINMGTKGFTLVELLIVVAILGVLSAVVLPNVVGLAGEGQAEAANAEWRTVQTAVDTMMAKKHITAVTLTPATKDMAAFPIDDPLYPDYLRMSTTKGTYSCSVTGLVTQTLTGYEP